MWVKKYFTIATYNAMQRIWKSRADIRNCMVDWNIN